MAQDSEKDPYIDVDNTIITPSPQRVRNILTLEERVAAIRAYNHRPMYTKVARMFNCSWEQIKNIISNSEAIMEFFEATKNQKESSHLEEQNMDIRQKKIRFLSECVYEYIQRVQHNLKVPITEELIRLKALEFQDFIKLDDFAPNKKWLNFFKLTYNISLSHKQISLTRIPPNSMDLRDIMTYCTKNRLQTTNTNTIHMKDLRKKYNSFDANTAEYESRRVRKLNFLQKALSEYLQRAKFHHKSVNVDDVSLQTVANEFNEILKVQDFYPTIAWIQEFRHCHNANQDNSGNTKRPPLSLDLKDILSFCSRMDNKTKACTIMLKPKEGPSMTMHTVMPKLPDSNLKFQNNSIIYLDEDQDIKDVKPAIIAIKLERPKHEDHQPPLKIRKIESINNDPELENELRQQHRRENPKESAISLSDKKLTIKLEQEEEPSMAAEITRLSPKIDTSTKTRNDSKASCTQTIQPNPQFCKKSAMNLAPPSNNCDDDTLELPRQISNFKDALRLLKPLEEYAMLRENYRAIGLITQLEEVLKNS